jgi:Flp pilus assembly protein TadD
MTNLGSVYYLQNKLTEAIQTYQEVLQVQPGNIDARMNFAKAYRQMGRVHEARAELGMVLQYQPSHTEAATMLRSLATGDQRQHH